MSQGVRTRSWTPVRPATEPYAPRILGRVSWTDLRLHLSHLDTVKRVWSSWVCFRRNHIRTYRSKDCPRTNIAVEKCLELGGRGLITC